MEALSLSQVSLFLVFVLFAGLVLTVVQVVRESRRRRERERAQPKRSRRIDWDTSHVVQSRSDEIIATINNRPVYAWVVVDGARYVFDRPFLTASALDDLRTGEVLLAPGAIYRPDPLAGESAAG